MSDSVKNVMDRVESEIRGGKTLTKDLVKALRGTFSEHQVIRALDMLRQAGRICNPKARVPYKPAEWKLAEPAPAVEHLSDDLLGGKSALKSAGLEPVDGFDDERN